MGEFPLKVNFPSYLPFKAYANSPFPIIRQNPALTMSSKAPNKSQELTPQQAKLVEELVSVTPKLDRHARRLALPMKPELFAEDKEGITTV